MLREEHRSREQYTSSWLSLDNSGNTSSCNLFPLHPINSSFTGQSVTTAASQIKPCRGRRKGKKNQGGKMFGGEQKEWKQRESNCTCEKRAPGKSDLAVFPMKTLEGLWRHVCDGGTFSHYKATGPCGVLAAPCPTYVWPFYSPSAGTEVHIYSDVSLTRNPTQPRRCCGKQQHNRNNVGWKLASAHISSPVIQPKPILTVCCKIRYNSKNTLNKLALLKDATLFQLAQCFSVWGEVWDVTHLLFMFSVLCVADFPGLFLQILKCEVPLWALLIGLRLRFH